MSDTMDFAQWARNWEAMSREFLAKMPASAPASSQRTGPFTGQGAQSDLIERVLAGAQGYLGMLQGMAAAAGVPGGMPTAPWSDAFNSSFGTAPASPSWFNNPISDAMRNFGGHGAQGFEQMMQRFGSAAAPIVGNAKEMLSLPAFGHLREHQENAQKAAKAMIEYQEQMARYNRIMLVVAEKAFARFQLKLAEREEPGRQVDSVRGIYDLWIDAAEEAYAEIALSQEFRDIYGALVNAQMRVRENVQREVERVSSDLGVPTRSEIDSIGKRLQELRRAFREEREAGMEQLAAEVASLRAQLAALAKSGAVEPASNVVPFGRPMKKAAPATAKTRAKRAAKTRAKSVRQVVRAASKATPPAGKRAPVKAKARADRAAPASTAGAANKGFAAQIARFARESADAASSRKKSRKSGKR